MSDRNVINILAGTKLKIEKYTNEPNDKNVDLELDEGRIRLDVKEKYNGESSRFQIFTAIAVAGIRGTELIVSHKSEGNTTNVTVISGKVSVDRIGTLRDIMGFGRKGQVSVKTQQNLEVKKGSTGEITEVKAKEFEALKKETEIIDAKENGSGAGGTGN